MKHIYQTILLSLALGLGAPCILVLMISVAYGNPFAAAILITLVLCFIVWVANLPDRN